MEGPRHTLDLLTERRVRSRADNGRLCRASPVPLLSLPAFHFLSGKHLPLEVSLPLSAFVRIKP